MQEQTMSTRTQVTMHLCFAIIACVFSPLCSAQEAEPNSEAMKVMGELVEAFRRHPSIEVKSTLKITLEQDDVTTEGEDVVAEMLHHQSGNGYVKINGFTCYINDGQFIAVHEESGSSYYREAYDETPYWTFLANFLDIPYPHLALFWGDREPEFLCMELQMKTPEIVPVSIEELPLSEDHPKPRKRIYFEGPDGSMALDYDVESKLIDGITHVITGGAYVQEGVIQTTRYAFEYTVHDTPVDASMYTFDAGDRQRVDMLATLAPAPQPPPGQPREPGAVQASVGKPAPAFTLATLDGGAIDLEEQQGQVVILDFWATWCGPCRSAIPLLHEVASWAQSEDLPVRVITINCFESGGEGDGPDAVLEKARRFWQTSRFTLPVAMDFTNQTATTYGVNGIPATFIIRSDGTIHSRHEGFSPDYADMLKRDVRAALESLEAPTPAEDE
jgi:thiol-disulfide isomerase/thioredoxin